jgi:xylan 1,4-beta-xylosidase
MPMRSPIITLVAVALCALNAVACLAASQDYTNPIMPGDWSDPGVIRVGDDYYTCRSSFGWQPGIPIAHSRDLLHWEYVGHAFATLPGLKSGDTRGGVWGVEMGYDPNTRQFLIYAPTRENELYVFNADRPEGPYSVHKLGPNLGIDPGFFADDDGRLYLLLNRAVIYELSPDGLRIEREVAHVDKSRYRFFEGPDLFKHDGWYYLLFSDGGTLPHEPSTISTLRARHLEGPWEADPNNPVMFSTDNEADFQGPAHGTLIQTQRGEWYLTYHAHETGFYSLGRQMLMEPVEWTAEGWWRPVGGKVPSLHSRAPDLPAAADLHLAQSDEFGSSTLGLQWFFSCPPDLTGRTWSLQERPGHLLIHTAPGDLGALSALPAVFQQRVIDKAFSVETCLTFDARNGHEAAGLHLFHDPGMNLWIALTTRDGEKRISVGKTNAGTRTDLWSAPYRGGSTVWLRIDVDGAERATFAYAPDGKSWSHLGDSLYFGSSFGFLRNGQRGDPDLGWVGRYKDPEAPAGLAAARPGGNVWTGTTLGVFAVRDGAPESRTADFDFLRVVHR